MSVLVVQDNNVLTYLTEHIKVSNCLHILGESGTIRACITTYVILRDRGGVVGVGGIPPITAKRTVTVTVKVNTNLLCFIVSLLASVSLSPDIVCYVIINNTTTT
jgi:hypothetical protein